jgi:hypothetical protein
MRAGCMAQVVPYPSVINPARWYIHGAAQIRRGLPLVDDGNPGRAETRRRFALARPCSVSLLRL